MQDFSINGKQTIQFLDKDLEFLAGTGAGEGMSFYDVKDVIVNYQCAGEVVCGFKIINIKVFRFQQKTLLLLFCFFSSIIKVCCFHCCFLLIIFPFFFVGRNLLDDWIYFSEISKDDNIFNIR